MGADLVSGIESSLNGTIADLQGSLGDKPDNYWEANRLDYVELSDAAQAGYDFGEGIEDGVSDVFDFGNMDDLGAAIDNLQGLEGAGDALNNIGGNTADTTGNTGSMADALDITSEDLAYLRDIAEREVVNRITEGVHT